MVKNDQVLHRKKLIASFQGNDKRFYGYIRKLQTRPVEVTQLKTQARGATTNDQEIAEEFGRHFQEVYTREELPPDNTTESRLAIHQPLIDAAVTLDAMSIEKALKGLKSSKEPGPDGLHPMLSRKYASELSHPISRLFQTSFESRTLPSDWKTANIFPIYKKARKQTQVITDPSL
jgi:hypothetical protein